LSSSDAAMISTKALVSPKDTAQFKSSPSKFTSDGVQKKYFTSESLLDEQAGTALPKYRLFLGEKL